MDTILIKDMPVFLDNKDFQTILIKVLFPFEETDEDLANISLLPAMFGSISKEFPTEEEFQKEKKRRYILGVHCSKPIIGSTGCFSFEMIIPDMNALGKDVLEEQFQFLREVIYQPLLEKDSFVEKELEREKRNVKASMDAAYQNVRSYQSIKMREYVDDIGVFSRDLIHHPELLDQIHGDSLYRYYQKTILSNNPIIYVMGNVDSKKITSLCQKYLYTQERKAYEVPAHLFYFLKPRGKVLEIEENSSFKDSSFSFIYKVKDMTKEDILYLSLLKDLLTSLSSHLLSDKLRYEKDLIYSSKVLSYPHFGVFEITTYIQSKQVQEVKKALIEVMKDLEKEKIVAPLLENIKKRNKSNLLRKLDDKYFLFEDFVFKDLGVDDTLEEYYEKVEKITAQDISMFMKRMILDTIYFIKEEEHE